MHATGAVADVAIACRSTPTANALENGKEGPLSINVVNPAAPSSDAIHSSSVIGWTLRTVAAASVVVIVVVAEDEVVAAVGGAAVDSWAPRSSVVAGPMVSFFGPDKSASSVLL